MSAFKLYVHTAPLVIGAVMEIGAEISYLNMPSLFQALQ